MRNMQRVLGLAIVAALAAAVLPLPAPLQASEEARADPPPMVGDCDGTFNDRAHVAIRGFAFDPNPVVVERNAVVSWQNQDFAPHTTTEANNAPPLWDSGTLNFLDGFTVIFCQTGTFDYLCTIHGFTGVVEVVDPY